MVPAFDNLFIEVLYANKTHEGGYCLATNFCCVKNIKYEDNKIGIYSFSLRALP